MTEANDSPRRQKARFGRAGLTYDNPDEPRSCSILPEVEVREWLDLGMRLAQFC
jgi:hypothetical protein